MFTVANYTNDIPACVENDNIGNNIDTRRVGFSLNQSKQLDNLRRDAGASRWSYRNVEIEPMSGLNFLDQGQ